MRLYTAHVCAFYVTEQDLLSPSLFMSSCVLRICAHDMLTLALPMYYNVSLEEMKSREGTQRTLASRLVVHLLDE